jgi:hypothetical protein
MTRRLPDCLKVLRARLAFLESRVNSRSDPQIQKLIADTDAEISARKALVHYQRLVNLGQWRGCDQCHKPEDSGPMLHDTSYGHRSQMSMRSYASPALKNGSAAA